MSSASDTRFARQDTAGTPGGTSLGNRVEIISDGATSYRSALDDIQRAERFVWLETYILEPDEVGREFIAALADAARRGCDVRLIFDRFGSPKIGSEHARLIEEAGGGVAMYNPMLPNQRLGRKISSVFHRDHRKILIADGVGYTGGRNISTEYAGDDRDSFFDLSVRLQGPAVGHLATVFVDAFADATGDVIALPDFPEPQPEGVEVDVLELNNEKAHHDLDLSLRSALRRARASIFLATPYFVPPAWLMHELLDASERGVDVQLLTAGRSDVPFVKVAGRHLYGRLLKRGIRIFELQHPTLHAKFIAIDGSFGIVGSYNVDRYGSLYNLEMGLGLHDEASVRRLTDIFFECLERSEEVSLGDWKDRSGFERLTQWMAYRIAVFRWAEGHDDPASVR